MTISRIFAGLKQRLLTMKYRIFNGNMGVFMFHEVTNGDSPRYPDLSITKENFISWLDEARGMGIEFVPISDIRIKHSDKCAWITFDDIFFNACENAIPILQERKIPYTVFVTAEYVDAPGFLTSEQLELLKNDSLCTIGFHARNHVMMRNLNSSQIRHALNPKEFEIKFGIKCDYFAFPYGSVYACPRKSARIAEEQGYNAAFSTINSKISHRSICNEPWFIPRICVANKNCKLRL